METDFFIEVASLEALVQEYIAESGEQKAKTQDKILRRVFAIAHEDSERGEPSLFFLKCICSIEDDPFKKLVMRFYWEIYDENFKE